MFDQQVSPLRAKPEESSSECSSLDDIMRWLNEFPDPELAVHMDNGGDYVKRTEWVFRGMPDSRYRLKPTIERQADAKSVRWSAMELLILDEFTSRAHMHLAGPSIPKDEIAWLAVMQHYGVPTRLLDFTYSPFVALYFAVREGNHPKNRTHARLWALNSEVLNSRFKSTADGAHREEQERLGKKTEHVLFFGTDLFSSDRDNMVEETEGLRKLLMESLRARGIRRGELNRNGCVCATLPPTVNPRLASQQGLFLINCAEELSFVCSMKKMMRGASGWCKKLDIPVDLLPKLEKKLYQMNIHEQSLFPDLDGLAGFIRQKIRLHWK